MSVDEKSYDFVNRAKQNEDTNSTGRGQEDSRSKETEKNNAEQSSDSRANAGNAREINTKKSQSALTDARDSDPSSNNASGDSTNKPQGTQKDSAGNKTDTDGSTRKADSPGASPEAGSNKEIDSSAQRSEQKGDTKQSGDQKNAKASQDDKLAAPQASGDSKASELNPAKISQQKLSDQSLLKMADTVLGENKDSKFYGEMKAFRDQVANQIEAGNPVIREMKNFAAFGQGNPDSKTGRLQSGDLMLNKELAQGLQKNFSDPNIRSHLGYLMTKEGTYAKDFQGSQSEMQSLMSSHGNMTKINNALAKANIGPGDPRFTAAAAKYGEYAKDFIAKAAEHETYAYSKAMGFAADKGYLSQTRKYEGDGSTLSQSLQATRQRVDAANQGGKINTDKIRQEALGAVAGQGVGRTAWSMIQAHAREQVNQGNWKVQNSAGGGYKVLDQKGNDFLDFLKQDRYKKLD